MKLRSLMLMGIALLMVVALMAPMMATASSPAAPDSERNRQDGPTATPTDPSWLGFSTARDTLSEKLNRRITYVKRWLFIQSEFTYGILDGCTDLPAGEEEPRVYFGWKYIIDLLEGGQYEVRVSFDLKHSYVCDEVTANVDPAGGSTGGSTGGVGTVASGPMEIGAQIVGSISGATQTYLQQGKFKWVKIQASPGTGWAGFIADANAKGYKVLASVVGDKTRILTDTNYRAIYIDYLVALAKDGVAAIEVWNEPNLEHEWPAGQINGASYTNLLKEAYTALKAAYPNVIVISASPAPTGAFGAAGCTANGCNDDTFYQQMAQAGAGLYADCIGVHYNEGIISPRQSTGDPRDNYPTRYFGANLNRAMSQFPGEVACFTEIGYLSPEGYPALPGNFAWAQNTTVAQQAQWIAEAAVLASQLGRVRLFIVFNLNFTIYGADPQAGYALVRKDGTCPGCASLAAAQ